MIKRYRNLRILYLLTCLLTVYRVKYLAQFYSRWPRCIWDNRRHADTAVQYITTGNGRLSLHRTSGHLPTSGTDAEAGGVESARMRSSRKCATKMCIPTTIDVITFFMVALWNRADHYIFILFLLLLLFLFPRLISAVGDWMSTILPHMVWP